MGWVPSCKGVCFGLLPIRSVWFMFEGFIVLSVEFYVSVGGCVFDRGLWYIL